MTDFPPVEDLDNAQFISERLEREWLATHNLKVVLVRMYGKRYALLFFWYLVETAFKIGTAVLLGELLSWLRLAENLNYGILLAFGMLACALGALLVHHVVFFISMRIGMQLRVGFVGMIYRKCLLLSGSDSSMTGIIGMVY